MDIGRLLDGTPEPPMIHPMDLYGSNPATTYGDYVLPVPMTDFQKQLVDQVVSLHYSDILRFFETPEQSSYPPLILHSMNTLYLNSQVVCTHPYLLVDHYLPHNLLLKDVPEKLARSSGKFKVFADLVAQLRDHKLQIALVSRPGKSFDLIETFLLGKFINYKRYSGSYLREPRRGVAGRGDGVSAGPVNDPKYSTIHLIPSSTGLDNRSLVGLERFDFVIAFDQSFDERAPHIEAIRSHKRTEKAPIVRLISYYSIEHISLKFSTYNETARSADPSPDYLRIVIAALVNLRGRVGYIPIELKPIYSQGLDFLNRWLSDTSSQWPLPDLPDIDYYTSADVEKSLLTEVEVDSDMLSPAEDLEEGIYQSKRLKRGIHEHASKETEYSFLGPPEAMDVKHVLTHKILRKMDEAIQDNILKEAELEDHRRVASERQRNYEETEDKFESMVHKIADLERNIISAEKRAERSRADMLRAQEKLEAVSLELESKKQLLSSGPVELATLARQTDRITELETELKRTQERLESRSIENDYMQVEYQKASTAASEARNEIKALETDKDVLDRKLGGQILALKQMSFDNERQQKDAQIAELQAKLALLEEHLKAVMENQRIPISRPRYGGRPSSVPRRTRSPIGRNSPV